MKTLTNFRIDEDTRRDFHVWCIQNGTTIAENLREHISNTLGHTPQQTSPTSKWLSSADDTDSGINDRWEDSY